MKTDPVENYKKASRFAEAKTKDFLVELIEELQDKEMLRHIPMPLICIPIIDMVSFAMQTMIKAEYIGLKASNRTEAEVDGMMAELNEHCIEGALQSVAAQLDLNMSITQTDSDDMLDTVMASKLDDLITQMAADAVKDNPNP